MRVVAVVNQKGGVGKTTTTVNLGAAFARRGRRVLLVDMDPQGNLTDHLVPEADPPEGAGAAGEPGEGPPPRASVYDVLVEGLPIAKAVVETGTPGLFVVPSHEDLAGAELDLASVIGREVLLRDALEEVRAAAKYDYVLLDCPPSLGLLSLNALAAADRVFIALQTEFFAMRGLGALDRTIELVRKRINPDLEIGGIVATLVDPTRLSREVTEEVRRHYGERVFATRVRSSVRLAEAPSHRKHIFDYAPESPGAEDYAALAREIEEGRAAVEAPPSPPAAATASGPIPTSPVPAAAAPRRGIARAIADAVAGLSSPHAPPAPSAASVPRAPSIAAPSIAAPSIAAPSIAAPSIAAPVPAPAPPKPSAPAPPVRVSRPAVPAPSLRVSGRPVFPPLPPLRPPSALPRPATQDTAPAPGSARRTG